MDNETDEQRKQRLHETTWRRSNGERVNLKDMGNGELETVIDNLKARIEQEETKLLTDPKYEQPAQLQRANMLIANSKDKLVYLTQELNSRG